MSIHFSFSVAKNRAAGCVFGELLFDKPVLPGKSEINQLNLIVELLGTPNDTLWPGNLVV